MSLSYYKRGGGEESSIAKLSRPRKVQKLQKQLQMSNIQKGVTKRFCSDLVLLAAERQFPLPSRLSEQAMKQAMIFLLWFMTKHFSLNRSEHGESSFRLNLLMFLFIFRVPVAPRSCSLSPACSMPLPRFRIYFKKRNSWAHDTAPRT